MSVIVTLDLETIHPDSARAVIAALNCLIGAVELAPTTNFREISAKEAIRRPIPSQLPVGVPVTATDDPTDTNSPAEDEAMDAVEAKQEPAKRKPGRPRKTEVAVEQVDPTSAPTSAPEPAPAPVSVPAGTAADAPTLDDLRAALTTLTTSQGLSAGLALLQANNCARVSEVANLSIEAQRAFVAACGSPANV